MIPAKVGWAVGAWRLPQVFCLLCHPSRGFLLGQHSSLPALLGALGTISHMVPISTGPCYQREEAGITGKNMDFVGMSSALLEAIQQWKTQERKRRDMLCCCPRVTPAPSHASVTPIGRQRCKAGRSCCLWLWAEGYQHFPKQNKYGVL